MCNKKNFLIKEYLKNEKKLNVKKKKTPYSL